MRHPGRTAGSVLVALALLSAAPVSAQYFGKNKVQYRGFHFDVLKTEHFDIYFYPEERPGVEHAARMAERWYARLTKLLHHPLGGRQPLILYSSHPHFEQTNVLEGALDEGTGGVTESLRRRIILPFAGPLAETDHVLGHEIAHAFQYDISGFGRGSFGSPFERLPLWFIEGMAEYLSLGPVDPHTAMWMREAAQRQKLPSIRDLDGARFFPYRYGQAFWSYVAGRWGDEVIGDVLRSAGHSGNAVRALEKVLDIEEPTLSKDWHEAVKQAYATVAKEKHPASDYGRLLISETAGGGRLNIGPALSPNGRYVAFLSEKGLFSIELYLAETATGKVIRTLTHTSVDPHFESLQFINSAGAWNAEGTLFAFPGVSKGAPTLTLVEMPSGHVREEVRVRDVDEVFHPTFSPDGQQIAFSGQRHGVTDLFAVNVKSRRVRQLTNDDYADLQPAWSPDGRTIAFVTDRFSSKLEDEQFGNYRLASIDVSTEIVEALPSFPDGKNINPQWGEGGREIFFLSDHGGISNVFRMDTGSRDIYQLTDFVLGASGITPLSPSLSVAGKTSRLAFSYYENDGYRIYLADKAEKMVGTPVPPTEAPATPAVLAPVEHKKSQVADLLERDTFGLPAERPVEVAPYKARLALDYVAQPYLAVGADRFGTFAAGGTSLFWSDLLGNHNLATTIEVNGRFKSASDFSGLVSYQNRSRRLNWGMVVEQVPINTASFATGVSTDGLLTEETLLFRETHRVAAVVIAYPFNRAKRIELQSGVRNIGFETERVSDFFSPTSGNYLNRVEENLPSPKPLNLAESTAAFVHDTTLYGATSPILGRRYRFEVAPTLGSINYLGLLADYRLYLMPQRPFTLALRAMHYGRYGTGSEDPRLQPLFVGYPNLVHGYDVDTFTVAECNVLGPVGQDPNTGAVIGCPVYDRLVGSRIAVANAEVRFPLFGLLGAKNYYGPLPIEAAMFADTGIAWSKAHPPKAVDGNGDRAFVSSVGGALRINVLGFLIAEAAYVHPLDRPVKRWFWQFSLSPGF